MVYLADQRFILFPTLFGCVSSSHSVVGFSCFVFPISANYSVKISGCLNACTEKFVKVWSEFKYPHSFFAVYKMNSSVIDVAL